MKQIRLIAAAVVLAATALPAAAQTFPERGTAPVVDPRPFRLDRFRNTHSEAA